MSERAPTALVTHFYEAFARRDGDAMAACYAPSATFSDPVFPKLDGLGAGNMWRMLCERGRDLVVVASNVREGEGPGTVRAHWEATYTFSATGRKVHNVIEASFRIEHDLIVEHVDAFDFWRWSRMALGAPGIFLGWSPLVRGGVQRRAAQGLAAFRG